jgi:hypothetical protein
MARRVVLPVFVAATRQGSQMQVTPLTAVTRPAESICSPVVETGETSDTKLAKLTRGPP